MAPKHLIKLGALFPSSYVVGEIPQGERGEGRFMKKGVSPANSFSGRDANKGERSLCRPRNQTYISLPRLKSKQDAYEQSPR